MSTIKKSELRCSKSKSKDVHKAERLRQVLAQIKKDDEWPTVLSILECGLELVWKSSTMRVKAEHSAKPATEIMKDLEENKDYFLSDEGLKNFANEVYGWTGPVGKEFTPMGGSRRRGRYAHTQSGPLRKKRLVNTTSTKSAAKFEKGQATENDSPNKSTQNHISQDMSDSTESNGTAKPVGTLRERLTECIKCLDSSFAPQNVLFEGLNSSSNFAHVRERIITFLQNCCVLNDENVPTYLSTLYICGRPGTGKTTMVKHCVNIVEGKENIKNKSRRMKHCFIKSSDVISAPEMLFDAISRALGQKPNKRSKEDLETSLTSRKNKGPIILIVDEIDFLWKPKTKNLNSESVLDTIFDWASDVENRLVVIGISNSVGDESAKSIHHCVKINEEIIFDPFSVNDLAEMIKLRLGSNKSLVDENALIYVSRRIGTNKGDAREALQIMSEAVSIATKSLESERLAEEGIDAAVVKIPHVMKAFKGTGNNTMVNRIVNLPQNAKIVLCIATTLGQVSSAWSIISTSKLKAYCNEAAGSNIIQGWTQDQFNEVIELLLDADLISREDIEEDYDFLGDKRITVGVQLEDVELALSEILLKEGSFYSRMVEYVRKEDINQERV